MESAEVLVMTYVPPCSASVRANWSTETLSNLLRRLTRLSSRSELVVVSHSGYETREVSELARSDLLPAVHFVSGSPTDLGRLLSGEVAVADHEPQLLVYAQLAAALLPAGTADMLVRSHSQLSANCSVLGGIPAECSLIVYGRQLGVRAARLYSARLSDARRQNISWSKAVQEAACEAHVGSGIRTINAIDLCNLNPRRIPFKVDILSRDGIRRFERMRIDSDCTPLLEVWREEVERERVEQQWCRIGRRSADVDKTRVLFVSQSVAYSGAEEALCKAIERIPRDRFALYALLGSDGLLAQRMSELGVETIVAGGRFCDDTPESYRRLSRVFSAVSPDVVHFNAFSGIPPFAVAKLAGAACIHHLRVLPKDPKFVETLAHMDRVIAVSEFVRECAIIAGLSTESVKVVYDPVDTDRFAPVSPADRAQAKRRMHLDPDVLTVVMVARFDARKRHDVLVMAIANLISELDLQCVLVGESDGNFGYEQEVRSLIGRHGLSGRVFVHGFEHDIRAIESAADIAVLCSDEEPLGIFILECMSLGIPVIASKNSGVAEIIGADEECGLLCRNGDPNDLARCIRRMAEHPENRLRMAMRGRERCIQACGPGNDGLLPIFEALQNRH